MRALAEAGDGLVPQISRRKSRARRSGSGRLVLTAVAALGHVGRRSYAHRHPSPAGGAEPGRVEFAAALVVAQLSFASTAAAVCFRTHNAALSAPTGMRRSASILRSSS